MSITMDLHSINPLKITIWIGRDSRGSTLEKTLNIFREKERVSPSGIQLLVGFAMPQQMGDMDVCNRNVYNRNRKHKLNSGSYQWQKNTWRTWTREGEGVVSTKKKLREMIDEYDQNNCINIENYQWIN